MAAAAPARALGIRLVEATETIAAIEVRRAAREFPAPKSTAEKAKSAVVGLAGSAANKTGSLVEKGIGKGVSTLFSYYGPKVALGAALYNWKPVNILVNWVILPTIEKVCGVTDFTVPMPAQVLLTYQAYEETKKFIVKEMLVPQKPEGSKEGASSLSFDPKKTVIYSFVAYCAAQDPGVQTLVNSMMTRTVLITAAGCAAADYASGVLSDGLWVPGNVTETTRHVATKINGIYSTLSTGLHSLGTKMTAAFRSDQTNAKTVRTALSVDALRKHVASPAA